MLAFQDHEDAFPNGRETFKTGIPSLDSGLDGPDDAFILVVGQTGIGLTSMLARISLHIFRDSRTVLWVGASGNDRFAVGQRLVACESELLFSLVDQSQGDSDERQARVLSARERLLRESLIYLTQARIDPDDIAAHALQANETGRPLGLIVVELPSEAGRERSPADLWPKMKALAERHGVPVIVGVRMRDRRNYVRRFWLRDFDVLRGAAIG